jgi:hypothetical protein
MQAAYNSFRGISTAKASVNSFRGARDTLREMVRVSLGDDGERSVLVRQFTESVLLDIWPKDYLGQILAIRNMLVQPSPFRKGVAMFAYANDPRHVEMVKTPRRMVEEIMQRGATTVDCDDISVMAATMAMVVGRRPQFVALGFEPDHLTHVALRVQEPKSEAWIWMDAVAGPREREAAERAKEILVWDLD